MVHGVTGAKRLLVQKQKSLQVGVETDLQNTVPDWMTLDTVKGYVKRLMQRQCWVSFTHCAEKVPTIHPV